MSVVLISSILVSAVRSILFHLTLEGESGRITIGIKSYLSRVELMKYNN